MLFHFNQGSFILLVFQSNIWTLTQKRNMTNEKWMVNSFTGIIFTWSKKSINEIRNVLSSSSATRVSWETAFVVSLWLTSSWVLFRAIIDVSVRAPFPFEKETANLAINSTALSALRFFWMIIIRFKMTLVNSSKNSSKLLFRQK